MITLSIPTYNRSLMTMRSFNKVIDDQRISEIIICDDFSNENIYNELKYEVDNLKCEKIKLYRNSENLGSFLNKKKSVELSSKEWIILLDSDNIIDKNYIDIIINKKNPETIYCPSHAICESNVLNYTNYISFFDKTGYKQRMSQRSIWDCIFNNGNYFFNKTNYLNCIEREDHLENSFAADAYYLIYLWFKNISNSKFEVVEGLNYIHTLHSKNNTTEQTSHFVSNSHNTDLFVDKIINLVKLW